jgi:hypothetical protein
LFLKFAGIFSEAGQLLTQIGAQLTGAPLDLVASWH